MEPIRFTCQHCGKEVQAPASAAGRTGKCPYCGHSNPVPTPPDDAEDEDLIPLAPLDDEEETRRKQEVEHLLAQEEAILSATGEAQQEPRLEQRDSVDPADLHHLVVNYCLDMADSRIERAQTHAEKLKRFGEAGVQAVRDFQMDEAREKALDRVAPPLLRGFLKELVKEVSGTAKKQ